MKGYLNSIESFSTLDGPGIRSVVFLQGCPLRCLYCHNPETWLKEKGTLTDSSDIVRSVSRNINYISKNGGVTISGGEPTYQIDFLREILEGLKSAGLHTAVDTSGYVAIEDAEKILEYTDLFIVDIKHMDYASCRELTGKSNSRVFEFLKYLEYHRKHVWIRSVMVKGLTDDETNIIKLCSYVKGLGNIDRFELLPYHDMAKTKYSNLGLDYKLVNHQAHSAADIKNMKCMFAKHYGDNFLM